MNLSIYPNKLHGSIPAIPSKSQAHRLLVCAALGDRETKIQCNSISADIAATVRCLQTLGAEISYEKGYLTVSPIKSPQNAELDCGESGTTLRFLLPVVAALGCTTTFHMEGRLPKRPMEPLCQALKAHGVTVTRPKAHLLAVSGKLQPGDFTLPGDISSQFISGLLLAFPLLDGCCTLTVAGTLESAPYVDMTLDAMERFGVTISREKSGYAYKAGSYHSSQKVVVEGDWSAASFWLAANNLGNNIAVTGLDKNSLQGDLAISKYLSLLGNGRSLDISQCPDLLPVLAVAAANANSSTHFVGAKRLRMKESDRIESVKAMLFALGGKAEAEEDSLTVFSSSLTGGTVDSFGDHRIAMAAAVAATAASAPLTILGAECVKKSYPLFWEDYISLGGCCKEV